MSSADCNTEGINIVNESAPMVPDLCPRRAAPSHCPAVEDTHKNAPGIGQRPVASYVATTKF